MLTPQPKEVLALAQTIMTLEEQLATAKAKWNALFGAEGAEKKSRRVVDGADSNSLTSRILQLIATNPDVLYTIPTIVSSLGENELAIGRALYRLKTTGKISNPRRGTYTALESEEKTEAPGL
jgi:hypothetical protein